MSDVAAYHVFVCALFPVQGGMWYVVFCFSANSVQIFHIPCFFQIV